MSKNKAQMTNLVLKLLNFLKILDNVFNVHRFLVTLHSNLRRLCHNSQKDSE